MKNDTISRAAAIDALNGIINRFEQILRDIRESKVDDSVCGMCEYDGAFVGQSGDWCNECPGFEKDDCFKLSYECRKRWLESVKLPSIQPETNCSEIPNNCPAADVVPVVRCKDCKFREEDAFCTGRGFPCQLVPDGGFCDKEKKQKLQYADEIWRRMR